MSGAALNGELDNAGPSQTEPPRHSPGARRRPQSRPRSNRIARPQLNLFQTAKTGSPSEYAVIEETMSPKALDIITAWVVKR